jgi:thioredoxin-like negative regulator of GroEL
MLASSKKALDALERGSFEEACTLFDQSIGAESDPNALFQAAVCYRAVGRSADALQVLRRLDQSGHTNAPARLVRAEIFTAMGLHHQALPLYRQLLEIDDNGMKYAVAQGLYQCGEIGAARRVAQQVAHDADPVRAAKATLLLGRCLAAQEQCSEAAALFDSIVAPPALHSAARYRAARLNLYEGRFEEAEQLLRAMMTSTESGHAVSETLLQTLIHSGQTESAAILVESLTTADSSMSWLRHATDFLTESGHADPLRHLTARWAQAPNADIFRELVGRLLVSGDGSGAQSLIEDYATQFSRDGDWRWAQMRWLLDKDQFEHVVELGLEKQQDIQACLCEAQFGLGRYSDALETAQWLCRFAPGDQFYLALLVTALRCLDDPRHRALVDPDAVLFCQSLDPGAEQKGGDPDFWQSVADEVGGRHTMQFAPPLQSVRGGIQTPGNLLRQTQRPALLQLKSVIDHAAQTFFKTGPISKLADAHPLQLFRPRTPLMHASWAIMGEAATYHRSHVHSKGWYSGTCYIDVPEAIDTSGDAGYLVLGEPPFKTRDLLPSLSKVRPQVGHMVLFPSYFWHGTRPFAGQGRRQVVAFDYGRENAFV